MVTTTRRGSKQAGGPACSQARSGGHFHAGHAEGFCLVRRYGVGTRSLGFRVPRPGPVETLGPQAQSFKTKKTRAGYRKQPAKCWLEQKLEPKKHIFLVGGERVAELCSGRVKLAVSYR